MAEKVKNAEDKRPPPGQEHRTGSAGGNDGPELIGPIIHSGHTDKNPFPVEGDTAGKIVNPLSEQNVYMAREGLGRRLKALGYDDKAVADVLTWLDGEGKNHLEEALRQTGGHTTGTVQILEPQIQRMLQALSYRLIS